MLPLPPSPPLDSNLDIGTLLRPYTLTETPARIFTNWATTFKSQTSAIFRPTTVEQVRWVVELARREGKELRAAGAGHSPSDIVCTEGYIVDLKGLDKVLDVEQSTQTFHAEGGVLLRNLHPILLERGNLALSSLGSISDQTLAGAVATSTHGSGVTYGSLSSCVTFLDIVIPLPGAPVVRCSKEEDPDLFSSALCGVGAVGIVVGVGMRAERKFKLEEECFSMEFEEFTSRWKEIAESAEHVRCWWFPQVGRVKVSRMNRTTKAITPPPPAFSNCVVSTLLSHHYHAVALTISRTFPRILPYHAWIMWTLTMQPGPVRWGAFLKGLFGGLWGGKGPWPRLEDAKKTAAEISSNSTPSSEVEASSSAVDSPDSSDSPNFTLTHRKSTLATPPSDLLTPPLTPRSISPAGSSSSLPRQRQRSPLATEVETKLEKFSSSEGEGGIEHNVLSWPILEEDGPTYRVGWGVDIFNYDCGFPQYTYESCVPYTSTGPALRALESWHTAALWDRGYPLKAHFPIEIRWTEEDDVWLSPTYKQRGTFLGTIQYRPFNLPVSYRSLFTRFSTLLHSSFSGRPHWAKSHTLSPSDLRALYPRFDDFLAVRERVDPEGVLVNAYVRRHLLGLEEGKSVEGDVRRFKERK